MRVCVLAVFLFLSGCMVQPYKAESFGAGKRYALVSIVTSDQITARSDNGATLSGLIKAMASSDSGFSEKSVGLLRETAPLVEKAFAAQKAIPVMTPAKLKANSVYNAAASDEPVMGFLWMKTQFNVAAGYKYFGSEESLAALAQKMKLDGAIIVNLSYGVAEMKVSAFGLIAAGTHRAVTTLSVSAVDRDGHRLWIQNFRGEAKDSVAFVGDAVDFVKMHPMWVQATEAALVEMKRTLSDAG